MYQFWLELQVISHVLRLLSCFAATAEREEDQCELPGCTRPKRKEGDRTHNYCCRDHATQDAPNRDGQ